MKGIKYDTSIEIDTAPFTAIAGEGVVDFIFTNAPRKVQTRVARALEHYARAGKLDGIDEEMGAIRLVAAEEELVVAIFEWMKLNELHFPEHKDFVRKFKSHVVKLAFYAVLRQFRFVLSGMLENGITLDGLEGHIYWTARPIVEEKQVKLALYDNEGAELIRTDPLAIEISHGDSHGEAAVGVLLAELKKTIKNQRGESLREFLSAKAEFRNHLLYATDGGAAKLGDTLADLRKSFEETYHDLLWTLALVMGGKPPSKTWGIVSQFIAVYRLALFEAGLLKADNTETEPLSGH